MALRHLYPKPMIKTCPKHASVMSKSLPWILERLTAKEDQGLTILVRLELVCLITPLGHLRLQVLGLLLVLADLHSESSGYRLYRSLQILLHLELTLKVVDLLLGVVMLLL